MLNYNTWTEVGNKSSSYIVSESTYLGITLRLTGQVQIQLIQFNAYSSTGQTCSELYNHT